VLRQYPETEEAADWFVMYFDDDPDSLPLYYNTVKRSMTYDKPAVVKYKVAADESQQFQMLSNLDGDVTYTSFVDPEGQRWYLNLDDGEWAEFPEEWVEEFVVMDEQDADAFGFDAIGEEAEEDEDYGDGPLIKFVRCSVYDLTLQLHLLLDCMLLGLNCTLLGLKPCHPCDITPCRSH
jgi:hypothetical protein